MKSHKKIIIASLLLIVWVLIYMNLGLFSDWLVYDVFCMSAGARITEAVRFFIFDFPKVLLLLILISFAVGIIRSYFTPDKTRRALAGKRTFTGNVLASVLGIVTPFCSCSAIPMTVGFLNAGVPFGSTMSFLIASPLLNPIIIGMLGAMVGIKAMIAYFTIAFIASVLFGFVLEKTGMQRYVKNVRLRNEHTKTDENKKAWPIKRKLREASVSAWGSLRPVLGYLLVGVALGAGIYGYMPQDFVLKIAGPDNLFAIPVAAVLGIPLYIRAETAIPIGVALMAKGMSIGTVIALVIGGAGMAIPEMTMLASIFRKKLVIMIIAVIFLTAVIAGYLFNVLL